MMPAFSSRLLLLLPLLAGCTSWSHTAEAVRPPLQKHEKARAWNGGKPTLLPLSLAVEPSGEIEPAKDTTLDLFFHPEADCSELRVAVRGLDGLEIVSGREAVRLGRCASGTSIRHQVVVRVPAGVSGILVADVRMDLVDPDGAILQRNGVLSARVAAIGAGVQVKRDGRIQKSSAAGSDESIVELGNPSNSP